MPSRPPSPPIRRVPYRALTAVAVTAGLLLALFVPNGAAAVPAPTHLDVAGTWAWGGLRVFEGNGTGTEYHIGSFEYTLHGLVGAAAVLNQTNESSGALSVQATAVQGGQYTATLCAPSCLSPELEANISVFTWFREVGFANLTPQATVVDNGRVLPAWGIVDSNTVCTENSTRLLQWQGIGPLSGRSGSQYTSVSVSSQISVGFGPALGLVPSTLVRGENWSSNVSYRSVGSWSALYHAETRRQGTTTSLWQGSLNGSGNLSALGVAAGPSSLAPHLGAQAISLRLTGPWQIWNGLFVIPQAGSIYGQLPQPWYRGGLGPAQALTTVVDWSARVAHWGLVGTRTNYTATNLTVPQVGTTGTPGPGLPGPSPGALGPASVQATPLSPATAEGDMGTLLKAPTPSVSLPEPGLFPFGAVVILLTLAILGALVAPRWGVPPPVPEPKDGYAGFRVPPSSAASPPSSSPATEPPGSPPKEPAADPLSFLL